MNLKENNKKKLDIALLILFPVAAVSFSLFFKLNSFISTTLFFGLPSLYLSLRTSKAVLRTVIFTMIILILIIAWESITILNNLWKIPTIFPFKILGVTVEEIQWYAFLIYFILIFYEHFMDKGKHALVDRGLKTFSSLVALIFILFMIVFITSPVSLYIPYFYALSGVGILPVIFILSRHPHFAFKLIKVAPYFVLISLIDLFTSLELGYWKYTGIFAGWVSLFGYHIPYEELVYFVLLFSTAMITYFEFFDDRKHFEKM